MFLATHGCLISWPDFGLLFGLCRSEQEQHKLKAVSMASFPMRRNHFDIKIPTADVLIFLQFQVCYSWGPKMSFSHLRWLQKSVLNNEELFEVWVVKDYRVDGPRSL